MNISRDLSIQLSKKLAISVKLNVDIEKLIKKMKSLTSEDYSNYEELNTFVNLKEAGFKELKQTYKRYKRYLNEINNWESNKVDASNIRVLIIEFISKIKKFKIKNNKLDDLKYNKWLIEFLRKMKKIDRDLKKLVDEMHRRENEKTQNIINFESESIIISGKNISL
jgi:hypothetical protein